MDPLLPREIMTLEFCTRCGHSVSPYPPSDRGTADTLDYGDTPDVDAQPHYWCLSCREHWLAVNVWDTGTMCPSCNAFMPLAARHCGACGSSVRSETAITGNRPRARDNDVDEVFQLVLEGQGRRLLEVMARGVTPMVERDGLSPLHLAAACDDIDTAAILFESGAVIDVETWPESSGLASLRRFLRRSPQQSQRWPEAGLRESDLWVEVDRRTRRSFLGEHHLGALGCTPLHIASDRGCTAMVQWLLDHGANAHLSVYLDGGPEGFWSWSPLALAVGQSGEHPHSDVVLLLEQWAQDHLHTTADEAVARFRERRVPDSGSA